MLYKHPLIGHTVIFSFGTAYAEVEGEVVGYIPRMKSAFAVCDDIKIKKTTNVMSTSNVDRLIIAIPRRHAITDRPLKPRYRFVPYVEGRFRAVTK